MRAQNCPLEVILLRLAVKADGKGTLPSALLLLHAGWLLHLSNIFRRPMAPPVCLLLLLTPKAIHPLHHPLLNCALQEFIVAVCASDKGVA